MKQRWLLHRKFWAALRDSQQFSVSLTSLFCGRPGGRLCPQIMGTSREQPHGLENLQGTHCNTSGLEDPASSEDLFWVTSGSF